MNMSRQDFAMRGVMHLNSLPMPTAFAHIPQQVAQVILPNQSSLLSYTADQP
jgi:hypothetical protein